MHHFEMVRHMHTLQESILPGGWDAEEELDLILRRGFRLSPKDHWENNGILDILLTWSRSSRSSILWIGGKSGNQDCWVTELSADLIQALEPQLLTLLFAFCGDGSNQILTPVRLLKGLIIQLLTQHPNLSYNDPEIYNTTKFKRLITFQQLWRIFDQLALQVSDLFIIIDRIENCEADDQADLKTQLLPSLIKFLEKSRSTKAIVTSIFEPPAEISQSPLLQDIFIDTEIRSKDRN
jgi:hypothetical protein